MKRFAMLMVVAMFLLAGCAGGDKPAAPAAKTNCAKCGIGKVCACPVPAAPAVKTTCPKCGIGKPCTCPAM
jgi:hypothetical protein